MSDRDRKATPPREMTPGEAVVLDLMVTAQRRKWAAEAREQEERER